MTPEEMDLIDGHPALPPEASPWLRNVHCYNRDTDDLELRCRRAEARWLALTPSEQAQHIKAARAKAAHAKKPKKPMRWIRRRPTGVKA
jgi:hypothetical protein